MGHHEGYVQQGPNSNRAVTIKQHRVLGGKKENGVLPQLMIQK